MVVEAGWAFHPYLALALAAENPKAFAADNRPRALFWRLPKPPSKVIISPRLPKISLPVNTIAHLLLFLTWQVCPPVQCTLLLDLCLTELVTLVSLLSCILPWISSLHMSPVCPLGDIVIAIPIAMYVVTIMTKVDRSSIFHLGPGTMRAFVRISAPRLQGICIRQ